MDSIEKFFLPPCSPSHLPGELRESGERPTLYLLRRDLENLYLRENEVNAGELRKHRAPYLASIGILTGVDLMSKFYSNSVNQNQKWFIEFLVVIGEMPASDAEFLWEFRNALHHSYSLALKSSKNIVFTTEINSLPWHTIKLGNHIVNLWGLKRVFLNLAEKYRAKLADDAGLRERFCRWYDKAGAIFVIGEEKRPGFIPESL